MSSKDSGNEDDPSIRWKAAKALGKFGNKRGVEPLIAMLKDANKTVGLLAAKSLGEIGDIREVEPLITATKDTDSGIQFYARESIKSINAKNLTGLTKKAEKY